MILDMKFIRKYLIITILSMLLFTSGCATTTYFSFHEPDEQNALVYCIRTGSSPTIYNMRVYVNGEKAASIKNNSFVKFNLPAGRNEIKLRFSFWAAVNLHFNKKIEVQPNQTYYYLIRSHENIVDQYYNPAIGWRTISKCEASFDETPEDIALAYIRELTVDEK